MSNHVSILLHSNDAEELMQLLGRDDVPVDHWALADQLIDRIDAALANQRHERTRRRRLALVSERRWTRPLEEMGGYHHDG